MDYNMDFFGEYDTVELEDLGFEYSEDCSGFIKRSNCGKKSVLIEAFSTATVIKFDAVMSFEECSWCFILELLENVFGERATEVA